MSIRREPTYLSTEVWKCLWLVSNTTGLGKTVDELADTILREVIVERYPKIFEHHLAVRKMEKELLNELSPPKTSR